ncbi:hypothetical protein GCM10017691_29870 [Pseudonocardia petroleophila]|uniref:Uncharacterized protein n=1 Tax=Pseudonocardia petroleophila TaxID=37331 RepID=A0A7G7MEE4_9PSEU|nr:hypothetical protein [Pseudonocardia petroleophila]QNG51155.1 hypothetical protein H6H00_23760 [Pseudonocardia petroleophila]
MTDDMSRDALHELLFDGVAPPAGSDAMFAQTFAAEGSDGADLLPPDGLFDIPADDDLDGDPIPGDPILDDPALGGLADDPADPAFDADHTDDPALEDPALDDPALDHHAAPDADHDAAAADPALGGTDPAAGHPDPGTGW